MRLHMTAEYRDKHDDVNLLDGSHSILLSDDPPLGLAEAGTDHLDTSTDHMTPSIVRGRRRTITSAGNCFPSLNTILPTFTGRVSW